MKPYPNYKDSGVEWLGVIPEGWIPIKLKHTLKEIIGGGTPDTSNPAYWDNENGIPWVAISDITRQAVITETTKKISTEGRESKGLKVISRGTLLISIFASLGKTTLLGIDATVNQAILGLIPSQRLFRDYMKYYLGDAERYISYYSSSNTQENLNLTKIKNLLITCPSLPEQRAIAAFLDRKTSKIDTLIQKKEQQIELLKEQRATTINQAVTKGLDPTVPMKESGVGWLGEIPEGWDIKKLNHLSSNEEYSFVDGPFGSNLKNEEYQDSGIPLIQLNNIGIGTHLLQNLKFISEEKSEQLYKHRVLPYDIVIAKMADPVARAAKVKSTFKKYVVVADCMKFRPNTNIINTDFLVYTMNTGYVKSQAEVMATGTTRIRIGLTTAKKLRVLVPSLEEQKDIVSYLKKRITEFDLLTQKNERIIDNLREYRSTLISAAVTGKIDVREEAVI